jgi:hypothetical protein
MGATGTMPWYERASILTAITIVVGVVCFLLTPFVDDKWPGTVLGWMGERAKIGLTIAAWTGTFLVGYGFGQRRRHAGGESRLPAGALGAPEAPAAPQTRPQLTHRPPFYFAADDPIPFCPRCWEASGGTFHLDEEWDGRRWECLQCHFVKVLETPLWA